MAKHLYLPQLDDNANLGVPPRSGHWEKRDHSVLLAISDGITIAEGEKARGISSVPDVWARPLMFQTAIKPVPKNPHPLRKRAIQEWRGLMSLLALSKIKQYPLEVVPVELNNDVFSKALRKLAPEAVQLEANNKYQWTDILLIRYDGIPIGAFSPTTLVYTATDYRERLRNKDLVLKDEYGYLKEPSDLEELEAVGEWVSSLQKNLRDIMDGSDDNPDQKVVEVIHNLLNEWLKEMREKFSMDDNESIEAQGYKVDTEPMEHLSEKTRNVLERGRVYRYLLCPLSKTGESKEFHSDMSMALTLGRNRSKYDEVVVVTENLLRKNLRIWENLRLKDLGGDVQKSLDRYFNQPSGDVIDKVDLLKKNAIWIRPEKYFLTNTLLRARNEGNFLMDSEEQSNFSNEFVLPFRKEILLYFSPEQIREHLKPQFRKEPEGVRFTFYLPIASGRSEGLGEKVEKFYRLKKDVEGSTDLLLDVDVPVLEIFPNYLDKNWRRYYLFHSGVEQFRVSPVVDPTVDPILKSRVQEVEVKQERSKVHITEITSDNAFPEGIQIGDVRDEKNDYGLILIPRPLEPRIAEKSWKIGVDFGTSNTNVFLQNLEADTAEQWYFDFSKHLRRVTASRNDHRSSLLTAAFVPNDMIEFPSPTMLRIFSLAQKEQLLLDYFMFFPTGYDSPFNVYSDIKWDTDGDRKTGLFLESLLFLLLIDVIHHRVREIEIACSYPKAFTEDNVTVFKGEWKGVIEKLLNSQNCVLRWYESSSESGIDRLRVNERNKPERTPFFEIEGIASGEYFANNKTIADVHARARKEQAALCLDVGGGTTDISIWYENGIVGDASILLAGRQISYLLQKNDRIREILFSHGAAIALDEKKNEPTYFAARLNIILKREEARIQEMLLKHANKAELQWLRKMLMVEFCAISFYSALLIAASDKHVPAAKGLLDRIAEAKISLHWGGNAAKFINWVTFGKHDPDGIASKMLNAVFFQCLKDVGIKAKHLSQLQSPGHKSEVSGGLVVMPLGRKNDAADEAIGYADEYDIMDMDSGNQGGLGIVCGETIEVTDKTLHFLDSITNSDLFDANSKTKFRSTSLERLNRFVDIVNFFGVRFGLFKDDGKIKLSGQQQQLIKDEVQSNFIKAQSLDEGQRTIEPIFVMEMRVLLEILRNQPR